ncbi:putative alpha-L-fucosidase [Paenibacillus agaridevorans]|uniref:Putative alpha-L-fucosidase n=1 Tax=Paenibacillus agaridevorans TaxID=171404 RepID=A0A2R5ERL5_9BACL|nr:hypothetical protein [Paenibacillus agaridevorans]GBG09207.1 putative alpha-L-fucosidase [Paenibacillus agaridevorans]
MLKAPDSRVAVMKCLTVADTVKSVRLLGGEPLPFHHAFGVLTVQLPQELPTAYTNCLAIELE